MSAEIQGDLILVRRAPVVYDRFTGTDGASCNGRAPDYVNTPSDTWTWAAGQIVIRGNAGQAPAFQAPANLEIDIGAADHEVHGRFTVHSSDNTSFGSGFALREINQTNNWTFCAIQSTSTLQIAERATSQTIRATTSITVKHLMTYKARARVIGEKIEGVFESDNGNIYLSYDGMTTGLNRTAAGIWLGSGNNTYGTAARCEEFMGFQR